jgi:hypothetical protein
MDIRCKGRLNKTLSIIRGRVENLIEDFMSKSKMHIAFSLSMVLSAASAMAQPIPEYHPFLGDKFNLGIGLFWPEKSIKVRVDGTVPEEQVDFGETFRLDDRESTGSMMFKWKFGEKWQFQGQYWSVDTTGGAVLDEDVEWEDVIFKAGTFANAGFDISIARIYFGRTFSSSPKHEFGIGGGVHWMELGSFIEGQIESSEGSTEFYRGSVSADFPLPNIGGWYSYSWSPRWLVMARLDWLSVSYGDYSGGLWNGQAGINWAPFRHFGIGFYYNVFEIDVDIDKTDWRGNAETTQHGPFLALTTTW